MPHLVCVYSAYDRTSTTVVVVEVVDFPPIRQHVHDCFRCAAHEQGSRSPTSEDERGVVNKLDEAIEREVRPWLDLVDSLRAQGIQDELSLPQV